MERKNSRLLVFGLLIIVFVGGYYLWQEQVVVRRPLPDGTKILIQTEYNLCEHKESRNAAPVDLKVQTLLDLRQLYPSQEGWHSRFADEQVMVTRTLDDLCEKCSQVTHLGEKGGFVTVIKGPVGVEGEIVRVTTIETDILPEELRTKVEEGMLDLPDEETLLQIMDSLEEHH